MNRGRMLSVVVLTLSLGAAAFAARHVKLDTDITRFLPVGRDAASTELLGELGRSELNRIAILAIETSDPTRTATAIRSFDTHLRQSSHVAWVRGAIDDTLERSFYEVYFPHRFAFLADDPAVAQGLLTDDALQKRAEGLRSKLASPLSTFIREIANRDPWLLFLERLGSVRTHVSSGIEMRDGILWVTASATAVVFVASKHSAFHADHTDAFIAQVEAARRAAERDAHVSIQIRKAGAHWIAAQAAKDARGDIARVSIIGTVGVVLLLLVIFGSLRVVLLAQIPILLGLAWGFIATALVFGRVHGLTLAFGGTLIGIVGDYVAHLFNHHTLAPSPSGAEGSVRQLWPSLMLGAVTTIAGAVGLALTGSPAMEEMAVFTSVGVGVGLATTRWLIPPWLSATPKPTRIHQAAVNSTYKVIAWTTSRPVLVTCAAAMVAATTLFGWSRITFVDDMRALANLNPQLVSEDRELREIVAAPSTSRLIAATGDTEEQALARNDRVHTTVMRAMSRRSISTAQSAHTFIWSSATQQGNLTLLHADRSLLMRNWTAFENAGFDRTAFRQFESDVASANDTLSWAEIVASPLRSLVAPFMIRVRGKPTALTFVTLTNPNGSPDPELIANLRQVPQTVWIDQTRIMKDATRAFRTRVTFLLGLGLVVVAAILFFRYRSIRTTLAILLPSVLSQLIATGLLALVGTEITIVHVLSALLVLSMGVDFSIFVVESRHDDAETRRTWVSIVIACLTTVVSYGALGASSQPALRAIGLTTAIAILFSLVLAPLATLMAVRSPPATPPTQP